MLEKQFVSPTGTTTSTDMEAKLSPNKSEDTATVRSEPSQDLPNPPEKLHGWAKFKDSFRRNDIYDNNRGLTDLERANLIASEAPLQKGLKNRHVQMQAIGSCIGTGLFIGSGAALANGGPAALIIDWGVIGIMVMCTIQSLGELVVAYPVAGSFLSLTSRFVSPAFGFVVNVGYALQWCTVAPLELVAASLTIKYWTQINSAAWTAIFYVLIGVINLFGVRGYGEAEFFLSLIKVVAIFGFFILGIILDVGGVPNTEYIGGKYFHDPGAFSNGFKGVCSVLVTAAFSFTGTELCGLSAAETKRPEKTLPKATKQVVWRIVFFYMVSMILIGCLVPYNDDRLLSAAKDASASPFVIAIKNGGIKVLPHIFNAVILSAVLSVANAAIFASSRSIASLGDQGFAPKIFSYIDKQGRPLVGYIITMAFGLLSFLSASSKESLAFTWLMALTGLSSIITWGGICIAHIRFRMALKQQGRSTEELVFSAATGIFGSWLSLVIDFLVLAAELWISIFPLGGKPSASAFFQNYLNIVVDIALFVIYLVWKRGDAVLWVPLKDIDLDTGRRQTDIDIIRQERAEEAAFMATKPWYYRAYKFFC